MSISGQVRAKMDALTNQEHAREAAERERDTNDLTRYSFANTILQDMWAEYNATDGYRLSPEILSHEVQSMCLQIIEEDEYGELGVLADALEERGCRSGYLLYFLRKSHDPKAEQWASRKPFLRQLMRIWAGYVMCPQCRGRGYIPDTTPKYSGMGLGQLCPTCHNPTKAERPYVPCIHAGWVLGPTAEERIIEQMKMLVNMGIDTRPAHTVEDLKALIVKEAANAD